MNKKQQRKLTETKILSDNGKDERPGKKKLTSKWNRQDSLRKKQSEFGAGHCLNKLPLTSRHKLMFLPVKVVFQRRKCPQLGVKRHNFKLSVFLLVFSH
uniref:Uncharacterized protein n=1 Tax=Nothobranchius furzeri TaxID=105023 RepID=A0A8C6KJP2_NOTFU